MTNCKIELIGLRKVYPKKIIDYFIMILMSVLGRSVSETRGGIALRGLTLSIDQGERVGIIGQNGAGKSTLLQILADITQPTGGIVKINGEVKAILTLGVGLREELSGRENIYIDGKSQGKTDEEISAHIGSIIEFTELGKFIDYPMRTYSTGMKSRLAFAIATEIRPEILIIDETLSVGDAPFAEKSKRRIGKLCEQGSIVIIVSHNMKTIRELCNRCIWLDRGNLMMDGASELVTSSYLDAVRINDETKHGKMFQNLIKNNSYREGYFLGDLVISSSGASVRSIVSGAPLTVSCDFMHNYSDQTGLFTLSCRRLDGAIIFEHRNITFNPEKNKFITFSYTNFNLSPGFYQLELFLFDLSNNKLAETSIVMEVTSDVDMEGGRPILLDVGNTDCIILRKKSV